MNSFKVLFTLAFFVCLLERVKLLDNGLARTPPMGWMSWGYYMCGDNCLDQPHKCLDEELILSVVDTFYNDGYQEAGYEYIVIDDCWSERERDSDGRLVPDRNRFPHGMKFISDYIHSKGLKFGMYTNVANITCMHYPGSRGYFGIDAMTFAEWGVDYIKVDGCFVEESFLNTAYIKFGHYLNKTERPIVYSCSWPYYIEFKHNKTPDYSKVSAHCNLWRNYHDVYTSWPSVRDIVNHYKMAYSTLYQHHGPGGWNDPDMLTYFITLWVKKHLPMKGDKYHSFSFALVNLYRRNFTVSFTPGSYGLQSKDGYTVMDVFTGNYLRNITLEDSIIVTVPFEDVILYTLYAL
ncbi:PREDICTED: alpha-galactosidase A-like isoform X3 [Papilio polytes]|uniref:alpha-galactosidase A-like isoform X3 n=1 Tax=Papilio polytes TaxID=76194 RepID=UPI0006769F39|nr:PREDICTED: alpha-galactosidase A-like isoform X3 [Papilio polytes]